MDISQYLFDHYIMLTELIGLMALLATGVHLSEETKRATRVTVFLIILESIMFSMEQWTHIVFHITADNHWKGNPYVPYIPYIFFSCYAILFTVLFIVRYIKYNLRTILGVLYILASCYLGIYLNLARDSYSDYATLFSSVIVLYYLFLYQLQSKIDYLTGMLNRQSFYHDSDCDKKKITAICSVDMNELKWINDSKGHEAGDAAIKAVAECLMKNTGSRKRAYRMGGDEFVVTYIDMSEQEVKEDISRMRSDLSEVKIVCAFGYSMISSEDDISASLKAADKQMIRTRLR
ncbi:MAG: GGDEF domain-containing protein [Lachnospiraceae bacterium]|nr:GGDEF domain-containing protein [Lachnospiraceae bacterium]